MREDLVKEGIMCFALKGFDVKESDLEQLDRLNSLIMTGWMESTEMMGKVHYSDIQEI